MQEWSKGSLDDDRHKVTDKSKGKEKEESNDSLMLHGLNSAKGVDRSALPQDTELAESNDEDIQIASPGPITSHVQHRPSVQESSPKQKTTGENNRQKFFVDNFSSLANAARKEQELEKAMANYWQK